MRTARVPWLQSRKVSRQYPPSGCGPSFRWAMISSAVSVEWGSSFGHGQQANSS